MVLPFFDRFTPVFWLDGLAVAWICTNGALNGTMKLPHRIRIVKRKSGKIMHRHFLPVFKPIASASRNSRSLLFL
jgi:hypothetical protein